MAFILGPLQGLYKYVASTKDTQRTHRPPENTTETLKPFTHLRLDDDSSDTVTLSDGRKLGYAQYGDLMGKPIFVFHGTPGSRIDGAFFHDKALNTGARIICVDRPGIGWSSPHPNRKLMDHVDDVQQLAQSLGLREYAVLGISGGGPYALACAHATPKEQLKCAVLVCGLCNPSIGMQGAQFTNRLGFPYGFLYCPYWLAYLYWQLQPTGKIGLTDDQRLELLLQANQKAKASAPKKDLPFLEDEGFARFQIRTHGQTFVNGYGPWLQDGVVLCTPFEFKVENIREDLPVHLWYGKQDVNVPANHGIQTAALLGGRAYLRVEDETHGSMEVNYMEEYLRKAVKCFEGE